MKTKAGLILKLILVLLAFNDLYSQNNYTFLIDNSGSMLGYYTDKASTFKPFIKALIKNSIGDNDNVTISLFTRSDKKREIKSPLEIYSGTSKNLILEKIINEFRLMKGKDDDYGTTDIIEALDKSTEKTKSETQVIWIITDNINDNAGSGDSSYINTLEFYHRLRNDNKIRKILLFPIPEKISGEKYESSGFVCYAIVYSEKDISQTELEKFNQQFINTGIKQKPITLKPLDIGTITLHPKITQAKITEGKLFFDGKVLRGFGFEEGEKINEVFSDLVLKSNLFPYIIKSAKLSVRLDNFSSSDYSVKSLGTQSINPSSVSNVSPEGEVTGFSVTFNMPEISPTFSFKTIFQEDFTVSGNLILEVSQVDILLEEQYINNFKELFALNSIPDIFKPVLKDKRIETKIPLEIKIKYGMWRLILLIVLVVIIISIITLLIILLIKKSSYEVTVDNSDKFSFSVSVLSPYSFSSGVSPVLGKISKKLFGGIVFKCSRQTSTPGNVINIAEGIPFEIEYTDSHPETITLMFYSISNKKSSYGKWKSPSNLDDINKYH